MDNQEFDLLDELYFVKNIEELVETSDMERPVVKNVLMRLIKKHWVKILDSRDNEIPFNPSEFEEQLNNYHFIATKAGLLAHNGR